MKKKPSPEELAGYSDTRQQAQKDRDAAILSLGLSEKLPPVNTEEPGRPFVTRKIRETKW